MVAAKAAKVKRTWTKSGAGTFSAVSAYPLGEEVMKAYFTNLPTKIWVLLVVPAVIIAYPVVCVVVPTAVRAVVPDVVRTVLSVI
jgi:hypothetical protein